jgi:hypothetical protein
VSVVGGGGVVVVAMVNPLTFGRVQLDVGLHRFTETGGEDRDLLGLGEFNAEGEVLLELVDVVVGHRGKDGTSNLMDWCVLEGRSERWQAPRNVSRSGYPGSAPDGSTIVVRCLACRRKPAIPFQYLGYRRLESSYFGNRNL